jgi:hypothetical protein
VIEQCATRNTPGGEGEARGVQLVLGVGVSLVVVGVSCAKQLPQESLRPRRTLVLVRKAGPERRLAELR